MQTGTKISATAHLGLVVAVLLGNPFSPDPESFDVTDVSIITSEQFAALTQGSAAQSDPEPPEPPVEPEPVVPDVVEQPPEPEIPEIVEETPVPPEPEAAPPQVDRVAPEIVAPPEPETEIGELSEPEVAPTQEAQTVQEPQEATAPEAATDRIRPEDSQPETEVALAPVASVRPPARRPTAPVETAAVAESDPEPEPEQQDAINSALAEALGNADAEPAPPAGPPLSAGEKDALRVAVSQCWNVGSLSSAALATTVVVAVSMSTDGRPQSGSIRMLSNSGGDASSAQQAYEAARRAIIRCGARGFDLPAEKYEQWRDIEMTFNPERMRIR